MYHEHVQAMGSQLMKSKNLPQGRMVYPLTSDSYPNAMLSTIESGDFWYGDLEIADLGTLHEVAKSLKQSVEVRYDNGSTLMISA